MERFVNDRASYVIETTNQNYARHHIKDFVVDQKMMDDFFAEAMKENKELKMNEEQYKLSGDLMRLRLKAHIAQDLFGSESFYRIFNKKNEILMKAIDVLKSNDYNSIKLASN